MDPPGLSRAQLARLAFTDALTEIANRRAFDLALSRQWSIAARERNPLAVLMIDVDYFKLFNDSYGHQRGDRCLQQIALALQSCVQRPGDLAARYGGEEFVALLTNTTADGAVAVAERIRNAIVGLDIGHSATSLGRASVSVGVASMIPGSGGDSAPQQLLQAADEALYRAKLAGRNRVVGPDYDSATELVHPNVATKRGRLPVQFSALVGRKRELAEVTALIATSRLLTVVGVGGSGKTRIVVEVASRVAARFVDGVCFVDLSLSSDSSSIVPAIASLLGVRASIDGITTDALVSGIGVRELLLVIDNCEHLIDRAATVISELVRYCPNIRIIATSREPLGVTGESVYALPLLALPPRDDLPAQEAAGYDAVALFVERATAVRRDFVLTDSTVSSVSAVCRALDGIPLAIELAASRAGLIGLHDLSKRVVAHLLPLTGGDRTRPRQQTMDAAIAWSFDLLGESERRVFTRLAIFAGSFTFESATLVCAGQGIAHDDIFELLVQLIRKSMVAAAGAGRYRLLEPMREYALRALLASGESEFITRAHARAFAELAHRASDTVYDMSREACLAPLAPDVENFRAALTWSLERRNDPKLGARLVGDLCYFWQEMGMPAEGLARAQQALTLTEGDGRLWLTVAAVKSALWMLPHEQLEAAERALVLFERADERRGCIEALMRKGRAYASLREFDSVDATLGDAQRRARAFGNPRLLTQVVYEGALAATQRNDFAHARELMVDLISQLRAGGEQLLVSIALLNLAEVEFALGKAERALECTAQAAASPLDALHEGTLRANATAYLIALERYEEAGRVGREALGIALKIGDRVRIACAVQHLAALLALEGNVRSATRLLGYADAVFSALEYQREFTERYTHDRALAAIREHLDPEEAAALAGEGALLTDERAVEETSGDGDPRAESLGMDFERLEP